VIRLPLSVTTGHHFGGCFGLAASVCYPQVTSEVAKLLVRESIFNARSWTWLTWSFLLFPQVIIIAGDYVSLFVRMSGRYHAQLCGCLTHAVGSYMNVVVTSSL